MEMPNEELLSSLQQMIDVAERRMAEMCGMQLFKKREGFTQEDIYTLCGRDDAVATITLNPDYVLKEYHKEGSMVYLKARKK